MAESFALIVNVKEPIFEQLMLVHLSQEFLLEQKLDLPSFLSEILLPAKKSLGQDSASYLVLICH